MSELKVRPEVKRAHALMSRDPDAALSGIDAALASDGDDPQAHWVRGLILAFALGRPEEALPHLERAYTSVIDNNYLFPQAFRSFAKCLAALDRRDAARHVLEQCLEVYPDELDAWIDHSDLAKSAGDFETAIRDSDEVLRRDPKHPLALYNRACYLALAGRSDEALDALAAVIAVVPSDREAARGDGDFASLHGHPRYVELTTPPRGGARRPSRSP